jgi:hypothetical protein
MTASVPLSRFTSFGPACLSSNVRCNMTAEALLREIRQAFAEVTRPTRTMADAEVEDDRSEASRFPEHDTHWWEVPDEFLGRCSAPMCFLAPADFVYYLPVYMSWFLRTEGGANSFSSESLIYYLSDIERGGRIAGLLDSRQRGAVISFLEFVTLSPNLCYFHEYARSGLFTIWKSTEPYAPPNGGPAAQFANSGAPEGPPSVS